MIKKIVVDLPIHVKKYFMFEFDGYQKKNGTDQIHIDKHSDLGELIHLLSQPILYTQKPVVSSGKSTLNIEYYTHVQSLDISHQKLPQLAKYMEKMFRRSLINEVQGAYELLGCDYGPLVARFLEKRGIIRDVDIDYQTARKIFRDHIAKKVRRSAKMYA